MMNSSPTIINNEIHLSASPNSLSLLQTSLIPCVRRRIPRVRMGRTVTVSHGGFERDDEKLLEGLID
jgi:hypothetical protein